MRHLHIAAAGFMNGRVASTSKTRASYIGEAGSGNGPLLIYRGSEKESTFAAEKSKLVQYQQLSWPLTAFQLLSSGAKFVPLYFY
jgi:hypothetical protein